MATTYITGDQTKKKILKESKKLFYKKGYASTTYDDICKAAGINRALIPYHFSSKQDLGTTIAKLVIDDMFDKIDSSLDASSLSKDLIAVIHITAYYRLLDNKQFSEFIGDIKTGESFTDYIRVRITECIKELSLKKATKESEEIITSAVVGIRKEFTSYAYKNSKDTDVDALAVAETKLIMKYLGYSDKKIEELQSAAISLLNLFNLKIKTGFAIEISYT